MYHIIAQGQRQEQGLRPVLHEKATTTKLFQFRMQFFRLYIGYMYFCFTVLDMARFIIAI